MAKADKAKDDVKETYTRDEVVKIIRRVGSFAFIGGYRQAGIDNIDNAMERGPTTVEKHIGFLINIGIGE